MTKIFNLTLNYNLLKSKHTQTETHMSETNPNISVKARIEWSENGYVTKTLGEDFNPIDDVNYRLQVATWELLRKYGDDYGYDKTKFNLTVIDHDDNDKEHTYEGRVDLGSETADSGNILEDHIIAWLEYCMSDKAPEFLSCSLEEKIEMQQWIIWMTQSKIDSITRLQNKFSLSS